MKLRIERKDFEDLPNRYNFQNDGDSIEKQAENLFKDNFPNIEVFWRMFIVPQTKRIDPKYTGEERIRKRDGISDDIYEISIFHYSVFSKFCYAYEHIESNRAASFDEFYAHLGSICDLVEDFFEKIFFIKSEIYDFDIEILKSLSKTKFMRIASEWYNENYSKLYDHYLSKGRYMPIYLIGRKNIIDEYFSNSKPLKEYKAFSQKLRTYRNTLIHSSVIGKIHTPEGLILVPKKERIGQYKKLVQVLDSIYSPERLKHDFIDMKTQMKDDYFELQKQLNRLWEYAISDYNKMMYDENNARFLEKYNIEII